MSEQNCQVYGGEWVCYHLKQFYISILPPCQWLSTKNSHSEEQNLSSHSAPLALWNGYIVWKSKQIITEVFPFVKMVEDPFTISCFNQVTVILIKSLVGTASLNNRNFC